LKTCLFAGPTLFRHSLPPGVRRFAPAAMGSVFRAVEAGYRRIAIVDGYFGNAPSVWHKEILFALSRGVEVSGAASMGALRAAELAEFGMVGVGHIFRLFRCGAWTDDDEVAVCHGPAELGFCPTSEVMANIRFTLRRLRHAGLLSRALEIELARRMKGLHFSRRTQEELRQQAVRLIGVRPAADLLEAFEGHYVDIKGQDAQALIAYLTRAATARKPPTWTFPATVHWAQQFDENLDDVPPLQ
jgi:hypothetical protein